ncbi:MAG: alpha/beta hydrolase [Patescibacteria group bacterium]
MGTVNKARLPAEQVFILHGWTYSTEKWEPFVKLLKQKGIKPALLKIPGLTESVDREWTIDDYVEWLKQKVDNQEVSNLTMKQFNNEVVLIGHSNGGRIALNFAIKYPQKLDRLILIDSGGVYHDDLGIRTKRFIFKGIAQIGKKLSSSEKLRSFLYRVIGESDYKNASPTMRQTMINLINSDKSLSLDKIIVKTLIIWGENDEITPLSDGKIMNKQIRNSKLCVIKGARHSPQFSHAEDVADIIINAVGL